MDICKSKSYVYLVQCTVTKRVKIGFARNINTRLRELQVGSPTRLSLVGAIEGTMALEKVLHAVFASKRLHGEWFDVEPENVAEAARSLTAQVTTDARQLLLKKIKPPKPTENFPLYAHGNGQWAKKVKGKTLFFGVWEEPEKALARFNAMLI